MYDHILPEIDDQQATYDRDQGYDEDHTSILMHGVRKKLDRNTRKFHRAIGF